MTIEQAKNNLIETLESMDKNKLSLGDLQMYANILKTISEIEAKSYVESLAEIFSGNMGYKASTVSDLK